MNRLNDLYIDFGVLEQNMNGEKDKAYLIQEREVISYDWLVIGAKNRSEALESFREGYSGEIIAGEESRNYKIYVEKIDGSFESHKYYSPEVISTVSFKRCDLMNMFPNCEEIVDHDRNVCESCLMMLKDNWGEEE